MITYQCDIYYLTKNYTNIHTKPNTNIMQVANKHCKSQTLQTMMTLSSLPQLSLLSIAIVRVSWVEVGEAVANSSSER